MSAAKPRLLIISFSDISNDARVKKQIDLFSERYRVTTCGFGPQPRVGVEHLQLEHAVSQGFKYAEAVLLRLRAYGIAYRFHPTARAALRALTGHRFDAVLANDLDTLGVAFAVAEPEAVHADLHEYFPGLNDQSPKWVRMRKPAHEWALRRYAVRAGSVTTVSDTIADRYAREFGFSSGVVRNAAPLATLAPTPVASPIRVVHSGGAQANRRIEVMMEAVAASSADVTLDLYLTGVGSAYHRSLEELAARLGSRITLHPPVPQSELIETLNAYDVGIHVLPPTNTNNGLALPNKFFDYVQARLALVIGPTIDMEQLLRQYDLGVVADGFDTNTVTAALDGLTAEEVERWKRNADAAAPENSAESQLHVWEAAVGERIAPA